MQGLRVAGDEAKSAEAQEACHTLAQELTEQRFPAPRMLSFKVTKSGLKLVIILSFDSMKRRTRMITIFI